MLPLFCGETLERKKNGLPASIFGAGSSIFSSNQIALNFLLILQNEKNLLLLRGLSTTIEDESDFSWNPKFSIQKSDSDFGAGMLQMSKSTYGKHKIAHFDDQLRKNEWHHLAWKKTNRRVDICK
jgi:hypothetical protein